MPGYLDTLRKQLFSLKNDKKKLWWENYVKHNTRFLGVGIPLVRKELHRWYSREQIAQLSYEQQLELAIELFAQQYAEEKIAGILFLQRYLCEQINWRILLDRFASLFQNKWIYDWNVCDWFCVKVLSPLVEQNGMPCAKGISQWKNENNLWQARCSVVAFVHHTNVRAYEPLILSACSRLISREERFAKTAVGWILRELSRERKETVVHFLRQHKVFVTREIVMNALKYHSVERKALAASLR